MVFYFTSSNCRLIRNILLDFDSLREISPNEYITNYVDSCPATIDDHKVTWISETFLSLQKHMAFFRKIALYLSETLSPEEQDFFIIIMQAITFQLEPVDKNNIFKTLRNLSQDLLTTFTGFLSNNEALAYIADVAKNYFDSSYITEYIIAPLFKWQPYISEIAHDYAMYEKKIEDRKIKPLTVPVMPSVLKRKNYKEVRKLPSEPTIQATQNTVSHKYRRMVTKSAIDEKLKIQHEQNMQKTAELINSSKAHEQKFPQLYKKKKIPVFETTTGALPLPKPKKIVAKSSLPPIRENATLIKRMNNVVKKSEEEDIKWLESLMTCYANCKRVEEMLEEERIESEKQKLYDIERKHLIGQISHEQAALAQKRVLDFNRKKVENIKKSKKIWENAIESYKEKHLQLSRKSIIACTLTDFRIQENRSMIKEKNIELAENMKKEFKAKKEEVVKQRRLELEEKIKMIKEIKALAMIAKRTKVPKIIDLTETSGIGVMCEMSLAELQERLVAMKIKIKEEIERKKAMVRENKEIAKKDLEEQKANIKDYFTSRTDYRKMDKARKKAPVVLTGEKKSQIDDLKKILEKKRAERLRLVEGAEYAEFADFIK